MTSPRFNLDSKFDAARLGMVGVSRCHSALHVDRAAGGLDHARKHDQDAVPRGLHDAAAVLCDLRRISSPRLDGEEHATFGTFHAGPRPFSSSRAHLLERSSPDERFFFGQAKWQAEPLTQRLQNLGHLLASSRRSEDKVA
jgi:hypothetical protein